MRRRGREQHKRYKVALWWATMNNLPYDILQFFWFPLSIICGKIGIVLHNLFSSRKRFLCSELIATGFYKENDYLFGKPVENVLPAPCGFCRPWAFWRSKRYLAFRSLTFLIFCSFFWAKFCLATGKFCPSALRHCAWEAMRPALIYWIILVMIKLVLDGGQTVLIN